MTAQQGHKDSGDKDERVMRAQQGDRDERVTRTARCWGHQEMMQSCLYGAPVWWHGDDPGRQWGDGGDVVLGATW